MKSKKIILINKNYLAKIKGGGMSIENEVIEYDFQEEENDDNSESRKRPGRV